MKAEGGLEQAEGQGSLEEVCGTIWNRGHFAVEFGTSDELDATLFQQVEDEECCSKTGESVASRAQSKHSEAKGDEEKKR